MKTFPLMLVALCAFVASCATPRPTQRVSPDPLQYGYREGSSGTAPGMLIDEFVQKGDSINDWKRLVTRQYFARGSAYNCAQMIGSQIKVDCPRAAVSLKRISTKSTLVEYSHDGCKGWEGHHSVRKFMDGRDGVYMIGFDMKNKDYKPSEFARWRQRIIEAELLD